MEELSSGRLRMGEERLARTQDEPKSALEADKAETSKDDRGKVNDPALLKPRTGHPNAFSRLTSRPPARLPDMSGYPTRSCAGSRCKLCFLRLHRTAQPCR